MAHGPNTICFNPPHTLFTPSLRLHFALFLYVFYRKSRVVCAAQDYCCYRRARETNRITGDKNRWRRDEYKQKNAKESAHQPETGSSDVRFHVLIHALYPRLQYFGNDFGKFLCSSRTPCRCATWMMVFCLLCLCIRIHHEVIHEV